jgi:hypothetical protein
MNYFYSGWASNGNLVSVVRRLGPDRANHGYYSCHWEAWDINGTAETAKSSASPVELGRSRQACPDRPATRREFQERITLGASGNEAITRS